MLKYGRRTLVNVFNGLFSASVPSSDLICEFGSQLLVKVPRSRCSEVLGFLDPAEELDKI